MINDILDFSKIEADKMAVETVAFEFRTVVEDVLELLAEQAYTKGLELLYMLPESIPTALMGDPNRLRQVLTNLVGNAIKFTDTGEVVVSILLLSESEHDAQLCVEVQDTGIGIPEDVQYKLFQAFTQADGSTTRKYGGTGLGLVISKRLVEIMGGEIGCRSEPGQGSTFWFTLPLLKQANPELIPDLALLRGLRVLYIDAHLSRQQMMACLLQGLEVEIDHAVDEAEALTKLHTSVQPYHAVLISLDDEQSQACKVVRVIETEDVFSHLKIIFLVPLGRRISDKESAHVTKPVRLTSLVARLKTVLELEAEERIETLDAASMIHEVNGPGRLEAVVAEDFLDRLQQFKILHGETMAEELFALFLDETPVVITHIRQALKSRDERALQQELYRLQGSSSSLGLRELERLCVDMIRQTEDGQFEGLEGGLGVIERAVKHVQEALKGQS